MLNCARSDKLAHLQNSFIKVHASVRTKLHSDLTIHCSLRNLDRRRKNDVKLKLSLISKSFSFSNSGKELTAKYNQLNSEMDH